MLRAELAKIKFLPLPRWTALAVLAAAVITGAAFVVLKPKNPDLYVSIPPVVVDTVMTIAGSVFGVWVAALENQRRNAAAHPHRRTRPHSGAHRQDDRRAPRVRVSRRGCSGDNRQFDAPRHNPRRRP